MRPGLLILLLVAGCHHGKLRLLGHRIASLGGQDCENRIIHRDSGSPRIGVFRYDDDGHMTSFRETIEGEVTFEMTRSYDARGRLVLQVEPVRGLGADHSVATWEYDDHDRVVHVTSDFDGDRSDSRYVYRRDGRIDRRIDDDGIVQYRYRGRAPLVIDELHDTGSDGTFDWGWRYTFADGRWLTRQEDIDAEGNLLRPSIYTYDERGQMIRRDFSLDAEGKPTEIDLYTWEDGHVTEARYGEQRVRLEYDDLGRLVRRWWTTPEADFTDVTTYAWSGDEPVFVERRDAASHEMIESWTIERGCWGDREIDLPLAPISSWRDNLDPIAEHLDLRTWWGSHEVL